MQGAFLVPKTVISLGVTIGKIEKKRILCFFLRLFIACVGILNYIAVGSNQFSLMEADGKLENESSHV